MQSVIVLASLISELAGGQNEPPPPRSLTLQKTPWSFKVQMKCFFIADFERAAKLRKIAVYRFLISLLVPEL